MPLSSTEVEASSHLRLLVMGAPKSGKTQTIIATAEAPVYVINSDDKYSLRPAARVARFDWDLVLGTDPQAIETALREAREGVKAGRYKTVVWDTITKYAGRAEETFAAATMNAAGEPDGRRFWPRYRKHLHGIIDRLFMLKAHVIVNAHYLEVGSVLIEGQTDKQGAGIVPQLGGQCRATIPAEFQDVVFLEKRKEERVFVTSASGVWGPGCRNLPGVSEVPADVQGLWAKMQSAGKKQKVKESK
jgi:hypothetical protein